MEDMAMYLLELLMNALEHGASRIQFSIEEKGDTLSCLVADDGEGMEEEVVNVATDPFYTSRDTRKVGMGLAFLKGLCELLDGRLTVTSKKGQGTLIAFEIPKDHIDRPPMGDIGEIILLCFNKDPDISIFFEYKTNDRSFLFDTEEIKREVGIVDYRNPEILLWVKNYINEGISDIV